MRFDAVLGPLVRSNFAQFAGLLCALVNSASYPQRDGEWVVAHRLVRLIGAVVQGLDSKHYILMWFMRIAVYQLITTDAKKKYVTFTTFLSTSFFRTPAPITPHPRKSDGDPTMSPCSAPIDRVSPAVRRVSIIDAQETTVLGFCHLHRPPSLHDGSLLGTLL